MKENVLIMNTYTIERISPIINTSLTYSKKSEMLQQQKVDVIRDKNGNE